MQQKKYIVFKILQQEKEPFTVSLNKQKQFPVHEHYLTRVKETTLIYKYIPDKKLNEEAYIEFLQQHFKRKYNALKVEYGSAATDTHFLELLS